MGKKLISYVEFGDEKIAKIQTARKNSEFPVRNSCKNGEYTLFAKFAPYEDTYRGKPLCQIVCAALPKGKSKEGANFEEITLSALYGKERKFYQNGKEEAEEINNLLPFEIGLNARQRDEKLASMIDGKKIRVEWIIGHYEKTDSDPNPRTINLCKVTPIE